MNTFLFPVEPFPQVRSAAHSLAHSRYAARLAAVLGNGAEWDYRGECYALPRPTGRCTCGHEGLRFLFKIHHADGREAIVGSTCITTYHGISPALVKRLQADADRLQAQADELEARARCASQSPEVAALLRQWSAAEYRTDQAAAAWLAAHPRASWLPEVVFRRPGAAERLADRREGQPHPFCRLPALVSVHGQASRLRKYLAAAQAEFSSITTGAQAPRSAAFAL